MEKVNGRYFGSCFECGHSVEVEGAMTNEPLVQCIPECDLKNKYAQGCKYLIPKCEHNQRTVEELKKACAKA